MKITALVENTSHCALTPEHGLSLYITTEKRRLLFDLGGGGAVFGNAEKLGIDLKAVDTLIISHGHNDHGGPLGKFLSLNSSAAVYIQKSAFENHYSFSDGTRRKIGLDAGIAENPRVTLLDGDFRIDTELFLVTAKSGGRFRSEANDVLYDESGPDDFRHEQNLIITENGKTALILGCGHCGLINILERTREFHPETVVGGFHLCTPPAMTPVRESLLSAIAAELPKYGAEFYTCHCTGLASFEYLHGKCPNVNYLSCGETIEI